MPSVDLFGNLQHQWKEIAKKWLGDCDVCGECESIPCAESKIVYESPSGTVNWDLYGKLLEGCARLLIQIIDSVVGLFRDDGVASGIPHLQLVKGMDSE